MSNVIRFDPTVRKRQYQPSKVEFNTIQAAAVKERLYGLLRALQYIRTGGTKEHPFPLEDIILSNLAALELNPEQSKNYESNIACSAKVLSYFLPEELIKQFLGED